MGLLGTAATTGLLYQPRMIGVCDRGKIDGMKIGMETELLGENLPQRHFVHHKSQNKHRTGYLPKGSGDCV
jgi:hypothetical protein